MSERHLRTAFGLALSIDQRISIPGLGRYPGSVLQPATDVLLDDGELDRRWDAATIRPLRARELRFDGALLLSVDFDQAAGYLLWTRDFGRVLIQRDGMELLCDPILSREDWADTLLAQALPLAATIRGLEVLHASGVVLDGQAVLIAGTPGAGKSSLAAALVRSGGQLLSDDAVALKLSDGKLTAYVGSVVLQLREAEDRRLSPDQRAALGRSVGSAVGRQRYLTASTCAMARVAALFLLERSDERPAIELLPNVGPFELIASTFNLSVRTPDRLQRQLDVVSAIASAGLTHRLRVQSAVDSTSLASMIRGQLAVSTP